MIVQSIEVHRPPASLYIPRGRQQNTPHKTKWRGREGTPDHKTFVFRRAYSGCHWEEGDELLYKRQPVQIMTILKEETDEGVEWEGLSPKFIEVWLVGTNEFFMVHPSNLKRPRK